MWRLPPPHLFQEVVQKFWKPQQAEGVPRGGCVDDNAVEVIPVDAQNTYTCKQPKEKMHHTTTVQQYMDSYRT